MVTYNLQEAKGVIAAIVKENGTTKAIQTPADGAITYVNGGVVTKLAFLEAATNYGQDTAKTVNKKDIVGTITKKITESSLDDTFKYDALTMQPAALGDTTIEFVGAGNTVHGMDATTNNQYLITALGFRKMLRSGNTYTIRIFIGCALDANNDADIATAKDIIDLEVCHVSSSNFSASGGGDVTISLQFDAETAYFPPAYNTAPR